jgi:hypothetical protein
LEEVGAAEFPFPVGSSLDGRSTKELSEQELERNDSRVDGSEKLARLSKE